MLFTTSSSRALKIPNDGKKMGQKEGLFAMPRPWGFGAKPRRGQHEGRVQRFAVTELTTAATKMKDRPD